MRDAPHQTYSFGDFTFDLTSGSLLRAGQEVPLRPKSFELLKYLVENSGRLITKEELIGAVWADTFVTEDALLKRLKDLRTALDDGGQRYIKTIPRRGYIFRAQVEEAAAPTLTALEPEAEPRLALADPSLPRPSRRTLTLVVASFALVLAAGAAVVHRQQTASRDRDPRELRSIAV